MGRMDGQRMHFTLSGTLFPLVSKMNNKQVALRKVNESKGSLATVQGYALILSVGMLRIGTR